MFQCSIFTYSVILYSVLLLVVLLLAFVLGALLALLCLARPHLNIYNQRSVKVINKPFKPKHTNNVNRRRILRRTRILESSTSSEGEASTSVRPNRAPGSFARYSGHPTESPSAPPSYESRREPETNESYSQSRSDSETPPPPYQLLRRNSSSSQSSLQTVRSNNRAESEDRQLLFREDSPSD